MKTRILFYAGVLSALAFTGCKDLDDNSEWFGSDGVVFTSYIEGLTSRASGSAWSDGDEVGIYMTANSLGTRTDNRLYTASASGSLTAASGQALRYPSEGTADFFAYYPYTSLSSTVYSVDVSDQSDPTAIDLLYSDNATGIETNTTVELAFTHQLSQIVINIQTDATITSTSGLAITISGMKTQANFELTDGTLTVTGSTADFDMNVDADGTTAEAIVIPTEDLTGVTLTFALNGMTFTWDATVNGGGGFDAGTKYTYTATLSTEGGQPAVSMGEATIEDWTDVAGGNINVDFDDETTVTGEEFVALDEPFDDGQGDFIIDNVTLPSALSYVWTHDSSYGYMKASAYVSYTNYAAESWLISPEIDLSAATTATLTFTHIINYASDMQNEQTLWVADASVTSGSSSGWEQVTIPNYPSGSSWTAASSGDIDLSAYAGKSIRIAFKYTSTESGAATWEVYDVKVVGNPDGTSSGGEDPDEGDDPTVTEGTELYISEYVEGSSYNKYIEIYNPTSETIDLSEYTLYMENYNSSGGHASDYSVTLTGTLEPGSVVVYGNSKATEYTDFIAISDEVMNFNGNDPVSLRKNGEIIDYLGNESDSYGTDVTLRRKSTVNAPSSTYNVDEWDSYDQNDVSGLGTR